MRHDAAAWDSVLRGYKTALEDTAGARFNSCLANYYRDGQDSVSWHADDEPELGPTPVIASVSLGDTRRFQVKSRATGEIWNLDLAHGDLLVMRGESQRDYLHGVPKSRRPIGARLNLTFRWVNS